MNKSLSAGCGQALVFIAMRELSHDCRFAVRTN